MMLAGWDRNFKIWQYSFSWSRLLLRSEPRNDDDTRVEILFSNVIYMQIPTTLSGLEISEGALSDADLPQGVNEEPGRPCKVFHLNEGVGMVIATHCDWREDNEWANAPTPFGPMPGVSGNEID
ncbi:hypothetical protein ABGB09_01300 [Streptomyces sp. B8F3]|uniref:hypothetical protein n=1 Tax=Streptomyces sp. B8F3 TaxID=3153573 RepID=UPI00325F7490